MKLQNVIHILILLICLGLLPRAQAVVPAPDGGYPRGNTAEGQTALLSLTTGGFNTAVGFLSLRSNSTGQFNTGLGAGTLLANTAGENTATGAGALLSNGTGGANTANGAFALFLNTIGSDNTANGFEALFSNTTGDDNTGLGNTALLDNTTGSDNTAVGNAALLGNTTGANNTAVGDIALVTNTIGSSNTAIGIAALAGNTTGNNSVALGNGAGGNATTGSNNVYIGAGMAGVAGESNACYISSIVGRTSVSGIPVLINAFNKLGTTTSSKRFKEEIKPMNKTSEALFALKPVTFRYKKELDPAGTQQFGLVAEEVEKVNRNLVVRDKEGKPYSVRYDQVNAMLLNEFLKEHRKVEQQDRRIQEQNATIAQLAKEVETVVARLKEQDSKIQKVTDKFEMNRSGPQVVQLP